MRARNYANYVNLGATQKKDHPVCDRTVIFYQIGEVRSMVI